MSDEKRLKPVWGAKNIGKFIGKPERQTFHMLEKGLLPARKIGGIWTSTEDELEDLLLGRLPTSNREVA